MSPSITTVKPSRLLVGETRHIQGIASKPEDVKLRGESFIANVTDQIIGEGIAVTRSIEGASTLTIPMLDDSGELRRHPLFQSRFELELDGLKFVFVAKEKGDDSTFTATCEAKNVWRLRQHKGDDHGGTWRAYREKVTRAEAWLSLVSRLRPKIPTFCPELHVVQPIRTPQQARADQPENDIRRGKGLDSGAKLTAKGVKATASQIQLADTMMRAAVSYGANREILIGLVTALINESLISNPSGGDQDSQGPLQVRAGSHPGLDPRDPVAITKAFVTEGFTGAGSALSLSKTADVAGWLGKVMWMAGATSYPGNQYIPEATKWADAFQGGSIDTARTVTETKRYPYTVAANEDWWAAGQRLFSEVNWRVFEAADLIYVIDEAELLQSRVRMRCREGAPGITSITWTEDTGQKVTELTVNCRADAFAAPPGAVVAVEGEGESVDGNYLVANINSVLANEDATITLKRPTKPLPEPAAETTTRTIGGGAGGGGNASTDYVAPFPNAQRGRIDMGVDFTGTGDILAIGRATVLRTDSPGWPNGGAGPAGKGIAYKLLDGPHAGKSIYVFEGITVAGVGSTVNPGQKIGSFYPGSSIEIGWYCPDLGNACASTHYSEGQVTAEGQDFAKFLDDLGQS